MAHFTLTPLAGDRVLVEGVDYRNVSGQQIVDASELNALNEQFSVSEAKAAFDETVREFFAPLTEAADAVREEQEQKNRLDEDFYVVIQEGSEGTPERPEIIHQLSRDSVILRLIEADAATERLIWVNDELEILPAV